MKSLISIPSSNFIGTGKHSWLVIGLIPGAEEETGHLILADDECAAQEMFVEKLHADAENDAEERQWVSASNGGRDHVISTSRMLA